MKKKLKSLLHKGASLAANTDLARKKILAALNRSRLARYGEVQHLELDLEAREIHVALRLYGEAEALKLTLQRYAILGEEPHFALRFEALEADREWVTRLAADFLVGRDLAIPEEYAAHAAWLQRLL